MTKRRGTTDGRHAPAGTTDGARGPSRIVTTVAAHPFSSLCPRTTLRGRRVRRLAQMAAGSERRVLRRETGRLSTPRKKYETCERNRGIAVGIDQTQQVRDKTTLSNARFPKHREVAWRRRPANKRLLGRAPDRRLGRTTAWKRKKTGTRLAAATGSCYRCSSRNGVVLRAFARRFHSPATTVRSGQAGPVAAGSARAQIVRESGPLGSQTPN